MLRKCEAFAESKDLYRLYAAGPSPRPSCDKYASAHFFANFAGSGLSGRSESQAIEITHQRLPSFNN